MVCKMIILWTVIDLFRDILFGHQETISFQLSGLSLQASNPAFPEGNHHPHQHQHRPHHHHQHHHHHHHQQQKVKPKLRISKTVSLTSTPSLHRKIKPIWETYDLRIPFSIQSVYSFLFNNSLQRGFSFLIIHGGIWVSLPHCSISTLQFTHYN